MGVIGGFGCIYIEDSTMANTKLRMALYMHFRTTKADVRERTNNGEDFDQDVEDFSDPDIDEVLNDIDDEGPKKIEDVHGSSFNNPNYGIVLRNELGGDILKVDPNTVHAFEFPEYADIVPAHRLTSNS
ncbi:hypothetical protein GOBAR_AA27907 [Gossypium barbadense]|uniref:Uncharacterized protein n=1 Tax=Gossypium barbadense TaxID=3634 RepID=A0A2P5WNU3_GOSBA|nr:hypothetical protein GOBAR_AA27907 [Gossypium barbadense]